MIHSKISKILSDYLKKDISKKYFIKFSGDFWIIDPSTKYWYINITKDGTLYWKEEYFEITFNIFALDRKKSNEFLVSFVSEYTDMKVNKVKMINAELTELCDFIVSEYQKENNQM